MLFDCRVRTGVHVAIVLVSGVEAVLVGHPFVASSALVGRAGVEHVVRCLLVDSYREMGPGSLAVAPPAR